MTVVHEADTTRMDLVKRHRFVQNGTFLFLQRTLADPLPAATLPDGFVVRPITGVEEAAERARALAAAFGAPAQPERYHRFMQAPGYVADLDLVAVAPDGRFAAFAMCWVDSVNREGTFEPVGTVPEWRGQGLARAVLSAGFQRLQARGAETATVVVDADEPAARQLYHAVGFQPCWSLHMYSLRA